MSVKKLIKQYSIAQARNQFTALVRDVEQEQRVELTRHGKPVAVLISMQTYQRLSKPQTGFWDAYQSFQQAVDLPALKIEDDIFSAVRDKNPGRDITW